MPTDVSWHRPTSSSSVPAYVAAVPGGLDLPGLARPVVQQIAVAEELHGGGEVDGFEMADAVGGSRAGR